MNKRTLLPPYRAMGSSESTLWGFKKEVQCVWKQDERAELHPAYSGQARILEMIYHGELHKQIKSMVSLTL